MIEATVYDWYKQQGGAPSDAPWRAVEVVVRSGKGGPYAQIHVTDDFGRVLVITFSPADLERLGQEISKHLDSLAE